MRIHTLAAFVVITSFGCTPNGTEEVTSAVAAETVPAAHRARCYSVELLGSLGGNTTVHKINERGQVIGDAETPTGTHAFFWHHGALTDIGVLAGGGFSDAADLNDHGQVTGTSALGGGGIHSFVWRDGVIRDLGTFGGNTYAVAINNRGQIVGNSITPSGYAHAFLWSRGVLTDLGTLGGDASDALDINDRGDVIGDADTADGESHSYLWHDGVMHDLGTLGGKVSSSVAINEHAEVTGWSATPTGALHAYLWRRGHMIDLGAIDSEDSFPSAINNRGDVVGDSQAIGVYHAVAWERRSLIDVATGLAAGLQDINDDGTAVGNDGHSHAIVWSRHDGITDLPLLDSGDINSAWSINRRGEIAGDEDDGKGTERAVLWKPTRCRCDGN